MPTADSSGAAVGGREGSAARDAADAEEEEWSDPWLTLGPPAAPADLHRHLHSADAPAPASSWHHAPPSSAGGTSDSAAAVAVSDLADIEAVLMPEWDVSMGRFVRMKAAGRLVIPPPPPDAAGV
jgi:hypothetical protein